MTAEPDPWELRRWPIRFVRPEAERDYVEWHEESAVAFTRIGMIAGLVSWILTSLALPVQPAERAVPGAAIIWLAAVPPIALSLAASYARRWRRWMLTITASTNAVTGFCALWLCDVLQVPEIAIAAACVLAFFGFTIFRLRPLPAAIAAGSYLAWATVSAIHAWASGEESSTVCAAKVVMLACAYQSGLLTVIVLDYVSRQAFRHERIIESQKETIARERARNEALLEQELSHQVAERSRELGAVLARVDASLDVRRLVPGERFDARYRIVGPLGAGAMGAVYEVERLTDSERLALKAVVGEVSGPSAARFAREAEIGARLRHPHLVAIVDVGISSGVPFLVMELVRGGSLEAQRERFGDPAWALPILRQIASGLAALHDAGVVHRDLKPANVLLSSERSLAKISDFGISRLGAHEAIDAAAATMQATPAPSALTGTGVVMGTPLYMAPEAARGGRTLDAAADVFALGILAYEMLGGEPPFSVPAYVLAMAAQPLPSPAPLDDRIPRALRDKIVACLSEDPASRPRVRAVLDTLSQERMSR